MGFRDSASKFSVISDGSTKAGVIKVGDGSVLSINCSNVNAAARFLKLYDMATAPATTDTPVYRVLIPGSTTGGVRDIELPQGISFATGIAYRLVTTVPDNGDTAVASTELVVNISYQ